MKLDMIVSIAICIAFIIILICIFNTVKITNEPIYPEPSDYAVDSAGVLSNEELVNLNQILKASDNESRQIGIAIVKTTAPLEIEEYGIKLAEKWKVGNKNTDNGIIIILATEDRKVRLEVGYGLEGQIPDAVAGRIIDESMIPALKENNWNEALLKGVEAIIIKTSK